MPTAPNDSWLQSKQAGALHAYSSDVSILGISLKFKTETTANYNKVNNYLPLLTVGLEAANN